MENSVPKAFALLLEKLSHDANMKSAIDQARLDLENGSTFRAQSMADLGMHLLRMGTLFLGRQKRRKVRETLEILVFIMAISLVLKKNVYDNPDVQIFLRKHWDATKAQSARFFFIIRHYLQGLRSGH